MINYCIVFSGNGMVFNFLPSWILAFFWQSLQFFHIFFDIVSLFKLLESQGPENLISGWIISYWKFFWLPWNRCQLLNITNFAFYKIRIFFRFWKFLSVFQFFQLQGPGNFLWDLLIGHFIVSSNNRIVFNILMSRILAFFW